jgi:uncharacterized membrane protein YheB (UPF0754 family)
MDNFLLFLAPPVAGAFIGYLTNYVAIRMLFRPLKGWRFLGMPVPMTPGVIPRQRLLLAENIGQMVGGHLLTSADVHKALTEEGFQRELQSLIEERLNNLLSQDLGPMATLVPLQFRGYFEVGVKILKGRLAKHLHNYLDSDSFAENVATVVDGRLQEILAAESGAYLSAAERDRVGDAARDAANRLFAEPWVGERVREYLNDRLSAAIAEQGSLADLLPAGLPLLLQDKLEKETVRLLAKIAEHLDEPEMQDKIARAIGKALQNFIGSLGPMAGLISNFLDPELIDRKVRSYLNEHREDLARWQFDENLQRRLSTLLREKLNQFLTTPVADLLARVNPELIVSIREELSKQLVALLRKPETSQLLGTLLRQGLDRQADRPLRETLAGLTGEEGLERGQAWATAEIIVLLRSAESKKILAGMISEILEENILARPFGSLASFLPRQVHEGISDYLLAQLGDLLVREVPALVDSLNIQKIVTRKVNSLDLLRLEGLLLSIMQEQFKYINLFGALLGFIIGSLNLLLILALQA